MSLADSDIAGPDRQWQLRGRPARPGGARLGDSLRRRETCHSDSATAASATQSTAGSVTQ